MIKEDDVIVAIMGKSGVGKTSVCLELKKTYGDIIHMVKSKTTRAERTGDPHDKESHIFCSEQDFKQDKALAVYNSPKGYRSWVDVDCFEHGKINLYTIDPYAYKHELEEYCIKNYITLVPVYIDVNNFERAIRYVKREKSFKGFSREEHLNPSVLGTLDDYYSINGSRPLEDVVDDIAVIINKVI
ncbi:MAG: hypothetical protein ACRC45_00565 [Cetobacterium sp.]